MVLARFDIPLGFGEKTVDEICQSHNIDTNTFLEVANFVSNNSFDKTILCHHAKCHKTRQKQNK